MRIRFIVLNAFGIGGTVRATLDHASLLAEHHDVEVWSVLRSRSEPRFAYDPRVRLRGLVCFDEAAELDDADAWAATERAARRRHPGVDLASTPSELIHPAESGYRRFSLLTDARLEALLRGLTDGAVIGTRPGLNLAIARWAGPKVFAVGQEHVYLSAHVRPLREAIDRYYPRLDAITSLTRSDVADYREHFPSTPIHHIPNTLRDLPDVEVDLDRKVVVAGGRLAHLKGFDLLIEAWEEVHPEHPDWQLSIYGGGPLEDALAEQIAASPARESITLHGLTLDLPAKLANGSIFVLSSRYEGFGIVLLEAMGHGLAVTSFACERGPVELLDHDVDGLLVPPEDVDALAASIRRLIAEPDTRRRLGEAARRTTERYAPEAVRRRWDELFAAAERGFGRRRRWLFGRPGW